MRYPFSPLWLVILYSIAGYSAEEVSAIGGWSLKTVASNLKKLQVPPSESDSNGHAIRAYLDLIRESRGNAAALHAISTLLAEVAHVPQQRRR